MRGRDEWAFMRVFRIEKKDGLYLWRLRILETPWFGSLKLHWIRMPDQDLDMHDHPWWFFSIILWGWYYEEVPHEDGMSWNRRVQKRRWFSFKPLGAFHRILMLPKGGALTLVICGPWRRKWGFKTWKGWVAYDDYLGLPPEEAT